MPIWFHGFPSVRIRYIGCVTDSSVARRYPETIESLVGSFPGAESLKTNQYYVNRQNSFWPIMYNLFNIDISLPYEECCKQLADSGVAVWDVLESVERQGSSDTNIDISTAFPNDLVAFLYKHAEIRHIFFNGSKAESLFHKLVMPEIDNISGIELTRLPSTSPANTHMSVDEKLEAWRVVKYAAH
ncbi:MAG: DNA-deoxyinosine glycosylase [Deltaproteobacteria bacterium]|nr:DNA-deoxyinosine glycosylase [Deltaproteobacteria bacterium]